MLLRYEENGGFWATPGGALEPGESYNHAVIRELREELGLQNVELGAHLATRTKDHLVAGQPVRQVERYYIARVQAKEVSPQSATQTDDILAWQWWTLPELNSTEQTVYPIELAAMIEEFLSSGAPETPVVLS